MARKINLPPLANSSTLKKEVITQTPDSATQFIERIFPLKYNFSITEAAGILNVSYDFIREHIICGDINATRFGDRWMINLNELSKLLSEGV